MPHAALRPVQCAALLALTLLSPLSASAQTAFTAKELKPPLGYSASKCDHATRYSLGDGGDVSSLCTYTAGYFFAPEYFGLFPLPYTASRPVVWRSSGASAATLSLPSGQEIKRTVGVDGQGRVLGHIGPILRPNAAPYDGSKDTLVWWTGTQRSSWSPALPQMPTKWVLGNVTASGKLLAFTNVAGQQGPRLVVLQGHTVTDIPLPPAFTETRTEPVYFGRAGNESLAMNDAGQVAVLTFAGNPQTTYNAPRVWFWNGQAWREVLAGAWPFSQVLDIQNVNAHGELMLTDAGGGSMPAERKLRRYIWREAGGLQDAVPPEPTRDLSARPQLLMDDGVVAGQMLVPQAANLPQTGQRRAALSRNGQLTDLNSLVPPPAGYVHYEVLDTNARGQLLVRMLNTDTQSFKPRLWLFTPR